MKLGRKAAEKGSPQAAALLGMLYERGLGVTRDLSEAVTLLKKDAGAGHSSAQYELGMWYEAGRGVKKDTQEAIRLYRSVAEQEVGEAKANLGELYEAGERVPRDHREAAKWYRQAKDQGDVKIGIALGNNVISRQSGCRGCERGDKTLDVGKQLHDLALRAGEAEFLVAMDPVPGNRRLMNYLRCDNWEAGLSALSKLVFQRHAEMVPVEAGEKVFRRRF
jgi:TPR repeat protein